MVAMFHFDVLSHFSYLNVVRNAYLFVDFFFVLSGFVIAANYRDRLGATVSASQFVFLRLGRIYPLHFLTMLLFVPIDVAKDGLNSNLLQAIVTNALLLQGLGINPQNWLNFVSWSISAEFAAYLVFAAIVLRLGTTLAPWIAFALAGPAILYALSPYGMNTSYDFGFVRCIYGFSMGVICFWLHDHIFRHRSEQQFNKDTLVECVVAGGAVIYVIFADRSLLLSVASPFVFALVVITFARQAGGLSRLMMSRPFLFVGTLTYSIYMLHPFVRSVIRAVMMVLEKSFHIEILVPMAFRDGVEPTRIISMHGSLWLGDIMQLSMMSATFALAFFSFRYFEEPIRLWSKRVANRRNLEERSSVTAIQQPG